MSPLAHRSSILGSVWRSRASMGKSVRIRLRVFFRSTRCESITLLFQPPGGRAEARWDFHFIVAQGRRTLLCSNIFAGLLDIRCSPPHISYVPSKQLAPSGSRGGVEMIARRRIHIIRGQKVMLDADLAELYRVETKAFNQAVKRNFARFPEDFMFQLTPVEAKSLRSQIVTS